MQLNRALLKKPSDLNSTDEEILSLLLTGRETRGSMADQLDRHENYVGERLKWLRATGLVTYYHEETALYEILEQGRTWASEANIKLAREEHQ